MQSFCNFLKRYIYIFSNNNEQFFKSLRKYTFEQKCIKLAFTRREIKCAQCNL